MSEVETPAQATPQADATATKPEATSESTLLGGASAPEVKPEGKPETTEQEKPAAKAEEVLPEKYELKLPEGSKLPETHLEEISSFAKEKKLSNEVAQALLEREHSVIAGYEQAQLAGLRQKAESWLNDVRNDKELGGDNFNQTAEYAKRAVEHFGDDQIKQAFDASGMGNHPAFVKMFSKIGKLIADDKFVSGNSDGASSDKMDMLYPSMKKK